MLTTAENAIAIAPATANKLILTPRYQLLYPAYFRPKHSFNVAAERHPFVRVAIDAGIPN